MFGIGQLSSLMQCLLFTYNPKHLFLQFGFVKYIQEYQVKVTELY